jgi:hypothetical protein
LAEFYLMLKRHQVIVSLTLIFFIISLIFKHDFCFLAVWSKTLDGLPFV